jgi:cell division protein FtsI (penicillin-binding protein 3)
MKKVQQPIPVWRFSMAALLLVVLVILMVWRMLNLQVLDTEKGYDFLQDQGDARSHRTEIIPAYRGVISDRNGEPLAVSTPVDSIWMDPRKLIGQEQVWPVLAKALGMPLSRLKSKINDNSTRGFIYLRRHMDPSSAKKILALKISGVNAQREYKRFYPAAEVSAHLVGFTNIDDQGQEGMELAFNHWLEGEAGSKRVLKDLHHNVIREIDQGKKARPGKDLVLSIDMRLQYLAYRELKAALIRSKAKSGSMVVLDSQTGEVLAMVNQPSYNPNNRESLRPYMMRNRAMTDVFEPGSTVKPLTVVAALESGKYQPDTLVDTNPGYIRVGRKTLLDPVNYGVKDVTKILTKSSQVGISKLALSLDEQSVMDVFLRFGLGKSTGSGFPGESSGRVINRAQWRPIERANFAFGYGLSVTPLQLAQAYSVFANGGVLRPATLLRQEKVSEGEQVISPLIAKQVVRMLETVARDGGTGTRAKLAAYSVAGKTGTVHKTEKGGYSDNRYRAIFAGMAPASNPRLVAVVMIDEPDESRYHGGESAAPVFSRVIGDALRLMDVVPDKAMAAEHKTVDPGRRKSA